MGSAVCKTIVFGCFGHNESLDFTNFKTDKKLGSFFFRITELSFMNQRAYNPFEGIE